MIYKEKKIMKNDFSGCDKTKMFSDYGWLLRSVHVKSRLLGVYVLNSDC